MSWIRVCILFLAASCTACTTPARDIHAPGENEPSKTIYLVNQGWHAGIVLRRTDIPESDWSVPGDFPETQYLEVGWGDKDFYLAPEPHWGLTLKAALWPTASVLYIAGFNGPVPAYFPRSEIIEIELSAAGFEQLSRTIAASFATDEAGNTLSPGPGHYGNSRFYLSRETYHLFNTCNVWTARVLRAAGLPVIPARAITTEDLMNQTRSFGRLVQPGPATSE